MNKIIKRILRSENLRPALNHIYKDSDDHEFEKIQECTCLDTRRYKNKKHKKQDKYYFS